MCQKFIAREPFAFANGAIGWRPGGPFDCVGPYAKVQNCPVFVGGRDTGTRLTCYATAHADTFFSIPAATRYRGRYVRGFFTSDESGARFNVVDAHADRAPALA